MPDLNDDLIQSFLPPSMRLGAPKVVPGPPGERTRGAAARKPGDEVGRLLGSALSLLGALLHGLDLDGDALARTLLSLAGRNGGRRRTRLEAPDSPNAALIPAPDLLAADVRQLITERSGGAGVSDDILARAVMGVEFAAGIEADAPGSVEAFLASPPQDAQPLT